MKKTLIPHLFLIFSFQFLYAAFPEYYYKIKDIKKQKETFVNIMLPLIQNENKKILLLRKKIINIFQDKNLLFNTKEIKFLAKTAKNYKIKDIFNKKEYLEKIDKIPPSLALAQAAIESGWGKSRFVKEANNIFGHWEYSNKGLAPKSKYEHIKINYSLKIFPSLEDSIRVYFRNLNRNRAYKEFRKKREEFRKENKLFTGIDAADTLKHYSQLKDEYVKRLKNLIISNNWIKYDNILIQKIKKESQ